MKKTKRLLAGLLVLVLMVVGLPMYNMEVKAEEWGDYKYKVLEDGNSVMITSYNGNGGEVVIPSEIDGKKVVDIGYMAFSECRSITSIIIPDSVTWISNFAFEYCDGLTSLTIPGSVSTLAYAFTGCKNLTNVNILDGVPAIQRRAFYSCSSLTSIRIPGSVQEIDDGAIGYFYAAETDSIEKCSNLVIYGESGSAAETYARDNGFAFRLNSEYVPPKSISTATVTLEKDSFTYDGTAKTPSVTVKLDEATLTLNVDYKVAYSDNINVGTAKVTVTGIGNYTGSKSVNFTIEKAAEEEKPGSSIICKKKVYTVAYGAKPFKINVTSGAALTFTSSNSKIVSVNMRTGKATIRGTGIATITVKSGKDSVQVTVKVTPKKQSVSSAKEGKGRKLAVKWAKDKRATGYQVQISMDKSFKKIVKQKMLSKNTYTFNKLKTGKRYYVRVRSYKKVGKEKLYGTWSKTKKSGKIKV